MRGARVAHDDQRRPEPWASTVYLRRLCVDPGVDPGVDPCRRPASTYVYPLGRRFYVCRRRPASTCVDRRLSASTGVYRLPASTVDRWARGAYLRAHCVPVPGCRLCLCVAWRGVWPMWRPAGCVGTSTKLLANFWPWLGSAPQPGSL